MQKSHISKRKLQAIDTKQKIFNAAISLIDEKGFDQVKIEDICNRANVSKGLFYNYFTSKDQIVIEQFLAIDSYYQDIFDTTLSNFKGVNKLLLFVRLQIFYFKDIISKDLIKALYRSLIAPSNKNMFIVNEDRALYLILHKIILLTRRINISILWHNMV